MPLTSDGRRNKLPEEQRYVFECPSALSSEAKASIRKNWEAAGLLGKRIVLEGGMKLRRVDDGATTGLDVAKINRRGWLTADEVREIKGARRFAPLPVPTTVNEARELEDLPPLPPRQPAGEGGHTMPRVGIRTLGCQCDEPMREPTMAEPAWNCLVCGKSALLYENDGKLLRGCVPWPMLKGGAVRIDCGYGSKHDFGAGPTRKELLGCICDDCLEKTMTRLCKVEVRKRTEWVPIGDR